ncbi:MAG: thioredoxin family protein [Gammaproteobacteria bacterium]
MKIQLLVTPDCVPCAKAETFWRQISEKQGLSLSVLDTRGGEGKQVARRLRLKTFPALLINGALVAVGVQSPEDAATLLRATDSQRGTHGS